MRKIKEILRLKHELGLGLRQIARRQGLSHSTVSDYLARAEAAGITWPLPEDLDDAAVEARLFPGHGEEPRRRRPEPDWAWRYPQRVCKWRRRCTLLLDENPGLGSPKEESHRHGPADHEG
jgi:transcriptional regulator with XRE-family HTH domain